MRILTTGPYLDGTPRYIEYSGTSAAAAYVSAGAALVFALNPAWTSQDVVQHLLASAVTSKNLYAYLHQRQAAEPGARGLRSVDADGTARRRFRAGKYARNHRMDPGSELQQSEV